MTADLHANARPPKVRRAGGFTIVEVLVSVAIVASVALAILALLATAGDSASDIKASATARRAADSVREWIKESDFDSLYAEIRDEREIVLVAYEYTASENVRADGTPSPDPNPESGGGTATYPAVRRPEAPEVPDELDAVDRAAFLCRLTLLSLSEESAPELPDPSEYSLASLPLRIELFRVPPVTEVVRRGIPRRRATFSLQTHAFR